jgi:RNA polymerase subunit RPABC4/transcription elongation factor Spt4
MNINKETENDRCLVVEHPHIETESHYVLDLRCDRCTAVNPPDGEADESCPACGVGTLQEDLIGEILISSDDRLRVRILLRQSEAHEFLLQLDRVLREDFGLHMRALSATSDFGGAFPACGT